MGENLYSQLYFPFSQYPTIIGIYLYFSFAFFSALSPWLIFFSAYDNLQLPEMAAAFFNKVLAVYRLRHQTLCFSAQRFPLLLPSVLFHQGHTGQRGYKYRKNHYIILHSHHNNLLLLLRPRNHLHYHRINLLHQNTDSCCSRMDLCLLELVRLS